MMFCRYVRFTDSFHKLTIDIGETIGSDQLFSEMFPQNSERVEAQKAAPLRVIMGNPPYSIGQKSANDNAQNQSYPKLDSDIAKTYAKESTAGLNKSLYDAYIKAFRWSTDRLDPIQGGVVAFVSNGAWLDGNSTDGFRKELEKEFSSIWVFNLRGNQRTSGELSRKEGDKIFGSGSRTPIAITILVKNPKAKTNPTLSKVEGKATIHYHDIGDYLSREEKLGLIKKFASVASEAMQWKTLSLIEHGDWISQRNDVFEIFIPLKPEKKFDIKAQTFFNTYSLGVSTNRDAWVYNFSRNKIQDNMQRMIDFYNQQQHEFTQAKKDNTKLNVEDFIDTNPTKISWTRALRNDVKNRVNHSYEGEGLRISTYRPYFKQYLYFEASFIENPGLNSKLFSNLNIENKVIIVTGIGASKEFSTIISDLIPNLDTIEKAQCFPLYYYEERPKQSSSLFDNGGNGEFIRRDGVSDWILERAKKQYSTHSTGLGAISKEDIFYYVYGFLHCPQYREKFANDLKKMLPRLPLVDDVKD